VAGNHAIVVTQSSSGATVSGAAPTAGSTSIGASNDQLDVVVNGTARVTRDADTLILRENESVYLPLGCTHRLENPGKIPLTLIEVQSGSYLGEDDIVRLEDTYGRA